MSFRIRLLLSFLAAALAPVLILAWVVRVEMTRRLTDQFERSIEAQAAVIERDLGRQSAAIGDALQRLRSTMLDDNRFRRAVEEPGSDRRYVLDYAGDALDFTGLSVLQIQDEAGRILSSGHFRNEYDRLEPEIPGRLLSIGESALIRARSPQGEFIALARAYPVELAGQTFSLVGGWRVDELDIARLHPENAVQVLLDYPDDRFSTRVDSNVASNGKALIRRVPIRVVDEENREARFVIVHSLEELTRLQENVSRWFRLIGLMTGLLAACGSFWLSSRISRPLSELAEKTALVDLDRLDVDFRSRRRDEIGSLSHLLGAMTHRLRKSVAAAKDAERRAAIGELSRQVNHDIKNGLTPLRNVFRHLFQVASDRPAELPEVLLERRDTLDSSMAYLQNLAANYSRLSPKMTRRQEVDLNALVQRMANDWRGIDRGHVVTRLADPAVVKGDELSLRRIVENLVDNAFDSQSDGRGTVTISTDVVASEGLAGTRLVVEDEGDGMTPEQIEAAFADFYTTKEHGTGLGLSVVRRLVMDLSGTIRVESTPGKGSRFIVELPAA